MTDALRRLGRWASPVVRQGPALDVWGFRTTLRLAVTDGRAGLRRASSNAIVALDHCAVAHPLLDELVADGSFGDATQVTLRVGAATGDRLALITPNRDGVRLPDDVRVVGSDELAGGARAWIHEVVADRRWRISADSFFQTRPDGAAALVDVVAAMAGDALAAAPRGDGRPRTLLDAYSGVGLFAGSLVGGRDGWRAVTVESNRSAAADARVNLTDLEARMVTSTVERLRPPRADLVVADPSRSGLGAAVRRCSPPPAPRGSCSSAATRRPPVVTSRCSPAGATTPSSRWSSISSPTPTTPRSSPASTADELTA